MAKRISHKNVGEAFELRFTSDGSTTKHMLVGYHSPTGDRKDDTADFREVISQEVYSIELGSMWSAYRFNGRWCYGTSADILVVIK